MPSPPSLTETRRDRHKRLAVNEVSNMTKHPLVNRTSPKGTPFIGTCAACGKTNITSDMLVDDECENVRHMTNEEALIEAIEGTDGDKT